MKTFVGAAIAALTVVCGSVQPSQAASIVAQSACPPLAGACAVFGDNSEAIFLVRSFTFTAPRNSRANVEFQGSLFCAEVSSPPAQIDLTSQIVTKANARPSFQKRGGLRHAALLDGLGTTVSFNLASSRVIPYPNGGEQTVFFKIERNSLGDFTICQIYNASFTVTFAP